MARPDPTLRYSRTKGTKLIKDLQALTTECEPYDRKFDFPTDEDAIKHFLNRERSSLGELACSLDKKIEAVENFLAEVSVKVEDIKAFDATLGELAKNNLEKYLVDKKFDEIINSSNEAKIVLEKRAREIRVQTSIILLDNEVDDDDDDDDEDIAPEVSVLTSLCNKLSLNREIKLPKFDGQISEWDGFWDLFSAVVHQKEYADIEKLTMLLEACEGDAARALKRVPRKGSEYPSAIKILQGLYADKRRNRFALYEQLESLPRATNDASSLRNTLSDVMAIIAAMDRAEEDTSSLSVLRLVKSCFPVKFQRELSRLEFRDKEDMTIKKLVDHISRLIKENEHIDMEVSHGGRNNSEKTHLLLTHTQDKSKRSSGKRENYTHSEQGCSFCGYHNHRAVDCRKVPSLKERKQIVMQKRLCFVCLSASHQANACKASSCGHCKSRHHIAICPKKEKGGGAEKDTVRTTMSGGQTQTSGSRIKYTNKQNQSKPSQSKGNENNVRVTVVQDTSESVETLVTENQEKVSIHKIATSSVAQKVVRTMLMTVKLFLADEKTGEKTPVYAILDSGAERSFISSSLVQRLHIHTTTHGPIHVTTFGGNSTSRSAEEVQVQLLSQFSYPLSVSLLVYDSLTDPLHFESLLSEDIDYLARHDIVLSDNFTGDRVIDPEILIGMDYLNAVLRYDVSTHALPSGLRATPTLFGYVLSGAINECTIDDAFGETQLGETTVRQFMTRVNEPKDYADLWRLETIGITDNVSNDDENAMVIKQFRESVDIIDGKVFVKFPWRENACQLEDNFKIAYSRLCQQYHNLKAKPDVWSKYCEIFATQLESGIIERVDKGKEPDGPLYYIPHQAVIKPDSATTKIRIVLDASSKRKGALSLNDVLYQGPTILPDLFGMLLRARKEEVLLIGDVEKAFHMIRIHNSERDATRFLWLKDESKPPSKENLQVFRYTRVPFGINASPFLLGMSVKYCLELHCLITSVSAMGQDPSDILCGEIGENLYVDNMILGCTDTEDGLQKYRTSKQIFEDMAMNLREFATNDAELKSLIQEKDCALKDVQKLLGILWDTRSDELIMKLKMAKHEIPTKRKVLQSTHTTFDPVGFLTPLMVRGKIFLQDLWRKHYEWDDPLSDEDKTEWYDICNEVEDYEVKFDRCVYNSQQEARYELCVYGDASIKAYATCVYLRTITNDTITCTLIASRSRLAPIKDTHGKGDASIPRLELLGMFIGANLAQFVMNELKIPISAVRMFCDSEIALHWVHSEKDLGTFVRNKVRAIREHVYKWQDTGVEVCIDYVDTNENPADCATRGLIREEMDKHIWWTGPTYLSKPIECWPDNGMKLKLPPREGEEPPSQAQIETIQANLHKVHNEQPVIDVLRIDHASSFLRLKRSTAMVLRFLKKRVYDRVSKNLQEKLDTEIPQIGKVSNQGIFSATDLSESEKILLREHQRTFSADDLKGYKSLNVHADSNSILRCHGRLSKSQLPFDVINPVLLNNRSRLCYLIIMEAHKSQGHTGVNGTLCQLRQRFWIPKGRQRVSNTLRKCLACKKQNGRPYLYPTIPCLPEGRVMKSRPFGSIGIDFLGPFKLKSNGVVTEKCWVCLFTCMATRAVHLEVVYGLSAVEFLHALRRFMARRGVPDTIVSDNATNFKLGAEIVQFEKAYGILHPKVSVFLASKGVKWDFITPLSPWKGGFYERLVGSVKQAMQKLFGRRVPKEDEFVTVITEIEGMLNSRPLLYITSDNDPDNILRPIDFLIPRVELSLFESIESDEDDFDYKDGALNTREQAIEMMQKTTQYLNHFWNMWSNRYLTELRATHKLRINQKSYCEKSVPEEGEIVLLMDDNQKRGDWKMAKVLEVHHGADDQIRSVTVLLPTRTAVKRSINRIIPLEIMSSKNIGDTFGERMDASAESCSGTKGKAIACAQPLRTQPHRKAKEGRAYHDDSQDDENEETRTSARRVGYHNSVLNLVTILSTFSLLVTLCDANTRLTTAHFISCVKGGALVYDPYPSYSVEICGGSHCVSIDNPLTNVSIQFPAEIVLNDYLVQVKSLNNNDTVFTRQTCPPSPFCEMVTCVWCAQLLSNPQCWPRVAIGVTAVLLYMMFSSLLVMVYIIRKVLGWRVSCYSRDRKRHRKNSDSIPLVEIERNRKSSSSRPAGSSFVRIVTIFGCCVGMFLPMIQGCQTTFVIPASNVVCTDSDKNCTTFQSAILKMSSLKPEVCLHVKKNTVLMREIKIELKKMFLSCAKNIRYFSRTTETLVEYSKRCPRMGTCDNQKCAAITKDTLVAELQSSNSFPGLTYCEASCGGIGCDCFFPSSGCLFYRVFQKEQDALIHEIFDCQTWSETVEVEVTTTDWNSNVPVATLLRLKPNSDRIIKNTTLEVTGFNYPRYTILESQFMTDGSNTVILPDDFQPSLVCSNHELARNMSCKVENTCECQSAEASINCYCKHNDLKSYYTDLSRVLPVIQPELVISRKESNVFIQTKVASVEMAVRFDASIHDFEELVDDFTCTVDSSRLSGCYGCESGSQANITCVSSHTHKQSVFAEIECTTQSFSVQCSEAGEVNTIRFAHDRARVEEDCVARCYHSMSLFQIRGVLHYMDSSSVFAEFMQIIRQESPDGTDFRFPDIENIVAVCREYAMYSLVVTITLIVAVGVTAVAALGLLGYCMGKGQAGGGSMMSVLSFPALFMLLTLRLVRWLLRIPLKIAGMVLRVYTRVAV